MRYVKLPGTDLKASAICLGTAELGSKIDQATAFQLLDEFVQQGGNCLDTAKVYADWLPGERSASEKLIGRWMAARRNRDQVLVVTKGGHPDLDAMQTPRLSRQEITHDLDASLQHLGKEAIDLYLLHRDEPGRPVEEILDTLNQQVKAGKVRYFGCSNWQLSRLKAAHTLAKQRGIQGFVANQVLWNAAVINPAGVPDQTLVVMDQAMRQFHCEVDLTVMPFSSLASGIFYKLARDEGSLRHCVLNQVKQVRNQVLNRQVMYPISSNQKRCRVIKQIADEMNFSMTQVLLGYLCSQPFISIPIVGSRSIARLQDCLSAANTQLSQSQISRIDQAF